MRICVNRQNIEMFYILDLHYGEVLLHSQALIHIGFSYWLRLALCVFAVMQDF